MAIVDPAPERATGPVLLVRANAAVRRRFRTTLEEAGYEVLEAAGGLEAMKLAAERAPALIVQDLCLPDYDGLELCRRLHALGGSDPAPNICLAGFLAELDGARTGQFARILVKPVDPVQLIETVRLYLATPQDKTPTGLGRKLLVVEDDPVLRRIAAAWFAKLSYEVLEAGDGAAALALARQERPAVIVSDVLMPGMDGFGLCVAVRCDPELRTTRVILVSSAYVEPADRELARSVGADDYLERGEGYDRLSRAVEAALAGSDPARTVAPQGRVEEARTQRYLWQLDRQLQENARLRQRAILLESQLTVLSRLAVAEPGTARQSVVGEMLATCLDMAGIAKGAFFRIEQGRLVLANQLGFAGAELPGLRAAFGCGGQLVGVARNGRLMSIATSTAEGELARRLAAGVGCATLLLVPICSQEARGLLLLGARNTDLVSADALAFAEVLAAQLGHAVGLEQALAGLAASQLRYRALTEHANDIIAILTPDGHICEVNNRLPEILGYPPERFVGAHINEFSAAGREEEHVRIYHRTLMAGGARTPPLEILKADGTVALMEFSNTPFDFGGEPRVLAIGREVTEQVKAQEQLMVSDRMASVGILAAGVAHEINNPLSAVVANLDFALAESLKLAAEPGASPRLLELDESLRDASGAARRVSHIVRDLKIFSHSKEDRVGRVELEPILESTLRMAQNEIRHRARLVKSYGQTLAVEADEARLGQVFLNLVINAAQAIDEGHAAENEIRVGTSVDPQGRVVVEIADTGCGMSPEVQRRLFTPFFTTKPVGVGTGLGLSICHRIVAGLGGEIEVSSQEGHGTTFRVTLPRWREATPDLPHAAIQEPAGPILGARARLLVIDDEPAVARAVTRALAAEHEVVALGSAGEALARINCGERFDVILCDLMMPQMTGMDLHAEVERIAPEQAARMIFLSGGAFTPRARVFLDQMTNERIEKPFDPSELRALIRARVA